ncbi:kynureninase [Sphingomonas jatrophae]|uniref:Kynureninase n=1 Tax=Sphingomonas jatrophae TaxID=1166337 RepID=A0A1I6LJN4_9SPHN|nr:kynureninase [Sphingomonas jatrophae]SFS03705.1 Kynureninase [Sphingomonas jatrophae]
MTLDDARAADAADPLRGFRERFVLPDGVIYLDGNSLGALPAVTAARVARTVADEWGRGLIRSWNDADWLGAPQRIGALIAPLLGAAEDEVIVADSTSANLFKLLAAAIRATGRSTILTEPGNFPTDLHVAQGVAALLPGVSVRAAPADELAAALDGDTAVLLLSHVHYRSGARHDMAALSAAARAAGALSLWDVSHSVGAVPLDLVRDGADLAVGCGYKFLNGGPGAPAFLFVRRALQPTLASPITGWMGHKRPFAFEDDYAAGEGMTRFLAGTPPILGMAALEEGVRILREVDMAAVAAKSAALFDLFAARVAALAPELRLVSPTQARARGSHIAFAHPHAHEIVQALIADGVIGDFRAPDVLRFGLTPLYLGHEDVWRATDILGRIMAGGSWRDPRFAVRARVT